MASHLNGYQFLKVEGMQRENRKPAIKVFTPLHPAGTGYLKSIKPQQWKEDRIHAFFLQESVVFQPAEFIPLSDSSIQAAQLRSKAFLSYNVFTHTDNNNQIVMINNFINTTSIVCSEFRCPTEQLRAQGRPVFVRAGLVSALYGFTGSCFQGEYCEIIKANKKNIIAHHEKKSAMRTLADKITESVTKTSTMPPVSDSPMLGERQSSVSKPDNLQGGFWSWSHDQVFFNVFMMIVVVVAVICNLPR